MVAGKYLNYLLTDLRFSWTVTTLRTYLNPESMPLIFRTVIFANLWSSLVVLSFRSLHPISIPPFERRQDGKIWTSCQGRRFHELSSHSFVSQRWHHNCSQIQKWHAVVRLSKNLNYNLLDYVQNVRKLF